MSNRLRIATVILAVPNLVTGLWALFFPASWYSDFPMPGQGWVAAFGAYNEHFIQDIGGAYLGFGVLLLAAVSFASRTAIRAALIGFLAFSIPHFLIHIFVRAELTTEGYVGTVATLAFGVALALWLLVAVSRQGAD